MTVGILIITHDNVGDTLLETAAKTLGFCPLLSRTIAVAQQCDPQQLMAEAKGCINVLDQGDGVLVLTDIYGSTPSNIACTLCGLPNVQVISGINLPMLIRVLNYPRLGLAELTEKALSGGREGIMDCQIICLDDNS